MRRKLRVAAVFAAADACWRPRAAATTRRPAARRQSAAPSATGGDLLIWTGGGAGGEATQELAAQFGKENGVTVEVQASPRTCRPSSSPPPSRARRPDVVVGAHDWIGNLVQNGAIDPVQLTDEQKAGFDELAVKAVTFNGQIYGVPYAMENIALIRNTDLAPDAPATSRTWSPRARSSRPAGKVSEIVACRSGRTATRTTSTRSTPPAAATCSAPTPNGDYDPEGPGRRQARVDRGVQEDRRAGREGRGRAQALHHGRQRHRARSPARRPRSWSPARGQIADAEEGPASSTTSRRSPASPAASRPSRSSAMQAFYVAAKGKNKALAQEFVANYLTTPGRGRGAVQGRTRAPPALTAALDAGQGHRPGPGQGPRRRQGRRRSCPAIPAMAAVWDPFGKAEAAVVGGADPRGDHHRRRQGHRRPRSSDCRTDDRHWTGAPRRRPAASPRLEADVAHSEVLTDRTPHRRRKPPGSVSAPTGPLAGRADRQDRPARPGRRRSRCGRRSRWSTRRPGSGWRSCSRPPRCIFYLYLTPATSRRSTCVPGTLFLIASRSSRCSTRPAPRSPTSATATGAARQERDRRRSRAPRCSRCPAPRSTR